MAEKESFTDYLQRIRKRNGERLAPSSAARYVEHIERYLPRLQGCKDDAALLEQMNAIVKRNGSRVTYSAFSHYLDYLGKGELKMIAFITAKEGKVRLQKNLSLPQQLSQSARDKRRSNKILSQEELKKLLTEPESVKIRCLFSVLYDTACRSVEIVGDKRFDMPGLRVGDIKIASEDERKLKIYAKVRVLGKGGKVRTVYLGKHSVALIRKMLKERKRQPIRKRDMLFEFYKDEAEKIEYPNQYKALYRLVVKVSKKIIGRHIHPHCFRHTKATDMGITDKDGVAATETEIMAYLGHSDPDSSKPYIHILDQMGMNGFIKTQREVV